MKKIINSLLIALIAFCVFQVLNAKNNEIHAQAVDMTAAQTAEEMKAKAATPTPKPTTVPTVTPITTETPVEVEVTIEVVEDVFVPTTAPIATATPTPEPTLAPNFDISWLQEMLDESVTKAETENRSEKEAYTSLPEIGHLTLGGTVEEPEVSAALRFGTKYKANIKKAAGIANFSDENRLYILGHNNENHTIFSDLQFCSVGDTGVFSLFSEEKNIYQEYRFEVVFMKRYTVDEYEANNYAVLTDSPDYHEDYDIVLATCKHLSETDKGRYVLLCRLIEE